MNKEDCQWGIFDFQNARIDPKTGRLVFKKLENEEEKQSKQHEHC